MVGMANLPNELLLCICLVAQTRTLLSMEQTCRAWLLAIRQSDMELWKDRMLSRFPRMRMLLPILEARQTLLYRVLYRNQLEAECFESTANDANMVDYVFTVELLADDEVREVSCGRLREPELHQNLDTCYSWFEIGRLWDTQPQWFSRWHVAQFLEDYDRTDPRLRVFVTLGNHTLKLYESYADEFVSTDLQFGERQLSPLIDDITMDVLLSTNGCEPFTDADGTVHYSADEMYGDTGIVNLLIRSPPREVFDGDSMTRYLAALPWPKRTRGV